MKKYIITNLDNLQYSEIKQVESNKTNSKLKYFETYEDAVSELYYMLASERLSLIGQAEVCLARSEILYKLMLSFNKNDATIRGLK